MAPLCYAAKFDPFLSLDCAPTPSTLAQSKERKGSNFAIWQPWNGAPAALWIRAIKLTLEMNEIVNQIESGEGGQIVPSGVRAS